MRRRVVTPCSPITDQSLAAGLEVATALGLEVEVDRSAATGKFWLAGDDETRARSLMAALSDCDQVWLARGGYGAGRLVTMAGAGLQKSWRGSLWAFSDGTAFLAEAFRCGLPAWSAPPLSQLERLDENSRSRLVSAMTTGEVSALPVIGDDEATVKGRLFVANLAVLVSLIGTPLMPSFEHTVLVVEDVNEPAFRVDRFFWQLSTSGGLDGVVALVAGDFTGISEAEHEGIMAVLEEVARVHRMPLWSGLAVGHGKRNACLPIGAEVVVGAGRLEVLSYG